MISPGTDVVLHSDMKQWSNDDLTPVDPTKTRLWKLIKEIDDQRQLFGGPVVLTRDEANNLVLWVTAFLNEVAAREEIIRRLRRPNEKKASD